MANAPLLITAELPADILSWADELRRRHYPPERNRLRAHVTLFHALPPSAEAEVRGLLGTLAKTAPPQARLSGIMNLGRGTALDVDSPQMVELHTVMADRLHGLLTPQDDRTLRLHITIQNKVQPREAKRLQNELRASLEPRAFRFRGFGLYAWEDGLWRPISDYPFRGR
ncbi:2'-5' RNA ligase family protein [Altericroceibacterium xinjiangense]|uniref:2'-5' RNA ligase family protein n=1 Tax=Altericroceibacterium xinjiangense TaxID=762261 RepID=UPI000F7D6A16|nr:2'-5' RNA ligase family protein [Altericroceibacterium xinjiangense]